MTPARPVMISTQSSGAMNVFAALLEARTGQQIGNDRAWRIETALKPVMRDRGFDTLDQLAVAAAASAEVATAVVNALLNHESSFFRDALVFDLVASVARDLRANPGKRRIRIWSAGCSIGQEPLSLAITFAEAGAAGRAGRAEIATVPEIVAPPEILATDVSEAALARARAGVYSQFEIQRGLSVRRMIAWFDGAGKEWTARRELVRCVHYRRMNLVADPLPGGKFDIVLCRNVLLYLSPTARRHVLDRIATTLRPDGLLVLGAGETVIGQTDQFRPSQRYRGLYELANAARPGIAAA